MIKITYAFKARLLAQVLCASYGYEELVSNFIDEQYLEIYIYNKTDSNFNLIRICDKPFVDKEDNDHVIEKVNELVKKNIINSDAKFLDIHLSEQSVSGDELFDTVFMSLKKFSGVDVNKYFPKLYEKLFIQVNKDIYKETKIRLFYYKAPFVTYILIGICFISYILSMILSKKYDSSTAYILLGADYKTFTLGLKQYYRLLTMAFSHGSVFHLIMNMYSLYVLGSHCEYSYGRIKYLFSLFYCILIGSLTNGILNTNSLCVGISGGLYGLMFIYLGDYFARGFDIKGFVPTLIINVTINFMSNTAWQAHLGGFVAGIIVYYMFNGDNKNSFIISCILLFLALSVKYLTTTTISPFYGGTDFQVLSALDDFGFKNYASKLSKQLIEVYTKFGG